MKTFDLHTLNAPNDRFSSRLERTRCLVAKRAGNRKKLTLELELEWTTRESVGALLFVGHTKYFISFPLSLSLNEHLSRTFSISNEESIKQLFWLTAHTTRRPYGHWGKSVNFPPNIDDFCVFCVSALLTLCLAFFLREVAKSEKLKEIKTISDESSESCDAKLVASTTSQCEVCWNCCDFSFSFIVTRN